MKTWIHLYDRFIFENVQNVDIFIEDLLEDSSRIKNKFPIKKMFLYNYTNAVNVIFNYIVKEYIFNQIIIL